MEENFFKKGCMAARQVGERWSELCQRLVENLVLECKQEKSRLKSVEEKLLNELGVITSYLTACLGEMPLQVVRHNFRIGIVFLLFTLPIVGGEVFLVLWTFDPFQEIGVKKYLISLGITLVAFIALERILFYLGKLISARSFQILSLFMAVGAGVTAVIALVVLALVRGFLLKALIGARILSSAESSAALEFYRHSGPLLTLLFAAMAVAFALGGALLMREATERLGTNGVLLKLHKRKGRLLNFLAEVPSRLEKLEALPRLCENEFFRGATETLEGARRSEENRETRKARRLGIGLGIFVAALLLVIVLATRLFAGELIIAGLDLSWSELAVDHRGQTEFSKNLEAVGERILPNIGPASDLYVLGITGNSFGLPYYILRGKTGSDPGYFGELLKKDIQGIRGDWEKASRSLKPTEKRTDIFGFLSLAEMTFKSFPSPKRTLVLLSDMRHSTKTLDLEGPERLDPQLLEKVKAKIRIPELEGADICIYGVHCFRKTDLYYHDLKHFWVGFIALTKGNLKTYSNLREVTFEKRLP